MFDMSMESLLLPFESWWANVAYYWCAAIVINMGWANVRASRWSCDGKVALITGGSEGTGLAMAKRFVKGGASVSILARNVSKLESAKKELMELVTKDTQSVVTIPCDVADYSAVEKAVNTSLSQHGVKAHDFVVTSAGLAIPGYLAEQDIEVFRKIMEVNYFGTLNVIKVCIPHMIETNNEGSIIFVSSAATYCGMIGYTQYCPSKYAVRGLSDALRNEMVRYGIKVHIAYPSNIDTKGFETENKTKPAETKEIEGAASLTSPDYVADCIMDGVKKGYYSITNEALIELARIAGNGVSPHSNFPLEFLVKMIAPLFEFGFVKFIDYTVWSMRPGQGNSAEQKKKE